MSNARTGMLAGEDRRLGSYAEYRDTSKRGLVAIAISALVAVAATAAASVQPTDLTDCPGLHDGETWTCHVPGVPPAVFGALAIAAAALAIALIARRLAVEPCLRLGQYGIQSSIGLRTWTVLWADVERVGPVDRRFSGRKLRIDVNAASLAHPWSSTTHDIRLDGLSVPAEVVESEIRERLKPSMRAKWGSPAAAASAPDGGAPISGIRLDGLEVRNENDLAFENPTSDELGGMVDTMTGDAFLILSMVGSGPYGAYIQTARWGEGWIIEYRDPGGTFNLGAYTDQRDLVLRILVEWALGSDRWRERMRWKKVT